MMSFENRTRLGFSVAALGLALVAAACSSGSSDSGKSFQFAREDGRLATIDTGKPIDPLELCTKLLSVVPGHEAYTPYIQLATPENRSGNSSPRFENIGAGTNFEKSSVDVNCRANSNSGDGSFLNVYTHLPLSIHPDSSSTYIFMSTSARPDTWGASVTDANGQVADVPGDLSATTVNTAVCGPDGILTEYDPKFANYPTSVSADAHAYCAVAQAS